MMMTMMMMLAYLTAAAAAADGQQYKVGDLDAWGLPPSSNPLLYDQWSQHHSLTIGVGDSLFFLYPPTQDSVLQLTAHSYATCTLTDPILRINDGNSLFNITSEGDLFFVSGHTGRCQNHQKLHLLVGNLTPTIPPPPSSSPTFHFHPLFFLGLLISTLLPF